MAEPQEGTEKPKKPSLVATLGVVALLTAVAGGGGWLLGGILAPVAQEKTELAAEAAPGEEEHAEAEAGVTPAAPNIVALEPITTNLAYPAQNWVRLDVALVMEGGAAPDLTRTIHQDILAYMRTVSMQQLQGARGFQHLREDLMARASLRSNGRVSDIIFQTFVIE